MRRIIGCKALLCSTLMLLTLPGCSGGCSQSKELNKMRKDVWVEERATWAEFENIGEANHPDVGTISRLAKMRGRAEDDGGGGAPKNYCLIISNPKFQENIKKFADTPIPPKFADPEREAKKAELVKLFDELKNDCGKKAAPKEIEKKVDRVIQLWGEILKIPNQVQPPGDWAQK